MIEQRDKILAVMGMMLWGIIFGKPVPVVSEETSLSETQSMPEISVKEIQDKEQTAQEYNAQAIQLFEKGQFQEAHALWEKALKTLEYPEMVDETTEEADVREKETPSKEPPSEVLSPTKEEWRKTVEESEQEHQKRLTEQVEPIYQTARYYYRQGKFKQAKQRFEELQWIFPDYKSTSQYLARLEQNLEKEEYKKTLKHLEKEIQEGVESKTEAIYQAATIYYKHGELEQAKQKFEEVQRVSSDYKSTKKYLARIDADIKKEEQRYQEARKRELAHQLQQKQSTKTYKKSQKERSGKIDEKQRMQKLKKEIYPIYQSAVSLYKQKKYHEAKDRFREIKRILPDYKSSAKYLVRIDREIEEQEQRGMEKKQEAFLRQIRKEKLTQRREKERMDELRKKDDLIVQQAVEQRHRQFSQQAEEKYQQAVAFYKARNFIEAKRKFIEVEAIVPGYQSSQEYLSRIDADIEKQQQDRTRQLQDTAEEIFKEALALYKEGKLVEAREKFFEVDRLVSGYKTTKSYLSRLDRDIGNQSRDLERQRRKDAKLAKRPLQEKRKELKSNIEKEYKEAVKAYKRQQFDLAEEKLNQSETYLIAGGFDQDYLMSMQDKIKKAREQLEELRDQRKDRTRSVSIEARPIEVSPQTQSKQPTHREQIPVGADAQSEFARAINTQQGRIRAERVKVRQRFVQELEHLYKNAIRLYKSGDHQKAKELFLEIDQLWPGYEKVKYYLTKLEKKAEAPPTKIRSDIISEALDSLE